MATPKIIADFETQLSSAISIGDTSFTLASATDDDGVALPTGLYYFTVENGSANKEYLAGTLTGTSVASVVNVSRQGEETSGADRAHRVGSSVIISDFLTYKKYIDETTVAGAADADTATKGVLETATLAEVRAGTATGSTGAALAVTPDVLDDMPTEDEKAAMVGTSGTPSTSNKFVTNDDTSNDNTGDTVFRFSNGQGVSKKLAVSGAATDVGNNTTNESNIISETIPADLLGTTNAIRARIFISDFVKSAGHTATFRLKYGSTTLASVTTGTSADGSSMKGVLEATLFSNTASSQRGTIMADFSEDQIDTTQDYATAAENFYRELDTGTATEDSTGDLTFAVTVQFSNASTDNDCVLAGTTLELIS